MAKLHVAIQLRMGPLDGLINRIRRGQMAHSVADEAYRLMREYLNRNWSGHYPPASVPGAPPAIRSGALRDSFAREQGSGSRVIFYFDVQYAGFLEYGTRVMHARPFVRPALLYVKRRLSHILSSELYYG